MAEIKKRSTREAYGATLVEIADEFPEIVVLDADLSKSTMTAAFGEKHPARFFNAGIAEQNLMSVAAGLSASGKTAFASTFAVFATGRAYDQVRQNIAMTRANVKIAATHSGLTVGEDGASHQALEDIALMRVLPNMNVVVPADARETERVIRYAAKDPHPYYIRLGRPAVSQVFDVHYEFELGRAAVLREGKDVAIVACGYMVWQSLLAAGMLKTRGIEATVLNMSSIKPLDTQALVAVAEKCGAVVTAEEHSIIGGLGGAVAETLGDLLPTPIVRVGVKDSFGESGSPDRLIEAYGLSAAHIADAALNAFDRK